MEALRTDIVDRALSRSLLPEHRSILADVLAKQVLDRVIDWTVSRERRPVLDWVDTVLQAHPHEAHLYGLLPSTVSAALDAICEQTDVPEDVRRGLMDLQQHVDVRISAFRVKRHEEQLHAVDPVDAKIDELLYRLSAQDYLTAEHSRSVGMWCWRMAKRLSLSRDEAYFVSRSGLLHDIGKTKTPIEILTAARKLNEEEWVIMRRHAAEGEQIILGVNELRSFSPAVRSHHERFDGKGYPDGLERSSIPFAARVVAVADAFNAMIARRPYRAPLSPTFAIEELKRNSGTQWDPAAVRAMIEVVLAADNQVL
jgi:putative nucleotidyltransferase with HDIG domain